MAGPSAHPGDAPAPLRPNDLEDPARITTAQLPEAPGTTERPGTSVASRDPRLALRLSTRDLAALTYVGRSGIASQGQLHDAVFGEGSEVRVSRCVQRLHKLRLLDLLRWNRIGVNLLRLTAAGRELLIEAGVLEQQLFVSRWPTPSGFSHRLWINDTALALQRIGSFHVQTCWMLRRKLAGTSSPVPDLLAIARDGRRAIAIEIDTGSENLKKFVIPRIALLDEALQSWAPDAACAIVILTVGARRAQSLRDQLPATNGVVAVDLLPGVVGRPAVAALVEVFTRA